jgi:hypothetical protein
MSPKGLYIPNSNILIGMDICQIMAALPREVLNLVVAGILWLSVAILIWLHPAFWEAKD